MSNVATALSVPGRLPAFLQPLQAGLAGLLWVSFNLGMIWLGVVIQHPGSCSMVTGGVDGALLSIVAVTKVSPRLRSGATGLLGGISFSGLRKDASFLTYWAQSLHGAIDNALTGLNLPVDEKLHAAVESAVIWVLWVTILVVLASLVAEWVSASWGKSGSAQAGFPGDSDQSDYGGGAGPASSASWLSLDSFRSDNLS